MSAVLPVPPPDNEIGYRWPDILNIANLHRKTLIKGHLVAIIAAMVMVPIPLLMPLLVDEVLLGQPGPLVAWVRQFTPTGWHSPILYIVAVLLLTVVMRIVGVLFSVYQTRLFSLIAKEVTYRIRTGMLLHLRDVSMAEYETLGSGVVASHLVTDVEAIDEFISSTLSRFVVSVLIIIGVAGILLWMQWQFACLMRIIILL